MHAYTALFPGPLHVTHTSNANYDHLKMRHSLLQLAEAHFMQHIVFWIISALFIPDQLKIIM